MGGRSAPGHLYHYARSSESPVLRRPCPPRDGVSSGRSAGCAPPASVHCRDARPAGLLPHEPAVCRARGCAPGRALPDDDRPGPVLPVGRSRLFVDAPGRAGAQPPGGSEPTPRWSRSGVDICAGRCGDRNDPPLGVSRDRGPWTVPCPGGTPEEGQGGRGAEGPLRHAGGGIGDCFDRDRRRPRRCWANSGRWRRGAGRR